jgi:hypothetical protein
MRSLKFEVTLMTDDTMTEDDIAEYIRDSVAYGERDMSRLPVMLDVSVKHLPNTEKTFPYSAGRAS